MSSPEEFLAYSTGVTVRTAQAFAGALATGGIIIIIAVIVTLFVKGGRPGVDVYAVSKAGCLGMYKCLVQFVIIHVFVVCNRYSHTLTSDPDLII